MRPDGGTNTILRSIPTTGYHVRAGIPGARVVQCGPRARWAAICACGREASRVGHGYEGAIRTTPERARPVVSGGHGNGVRSVTASHGGCGEAAPAICSGGVGNL